MSVERLFRIGESRRLYYNGRLVVDPKPEMPNASGYRFQEFVGPILAPYDLKGVGLLTYRYIDPAKPDASFLYLPVLRRVRRLSTAQRADAFPGATTYPEEQDFYAGLLMLDMQLEHATYVPHPGADPPGHEGWHFNRGPNARTDASPSGSIPEMFSIASLVARGN